MCRSGVSSLNGRKSLVIEGSLVIGWRKGECVKGSLVIAATAPAAAAAAFLNDCYTIILMITIYSFLLRNVAVV
ncbi:MAG: hypothetical protein IPP71_17485 [Bacteroidetes bacterium]|nr:hypothetical protein [Bacteroidota bacterium]